MTFSLLLERSKMVQWILLSVLILFLLPCSHSSTIDHARSLSEDLLANYSRNLRPVRNQSDTLHVRINLELITIQEFDEVQEKLSITCVLYIQWTDELMVWNPADYGGIDIIEFESNQVWTPMLVLLNSLDEIKKVGYDDDWLYVTYLSNGSAFFYPGGKLSSKCDADVTYFPWDKHKCEITFTTWGQNPKRLDVKPLSKNVQQKYYTPNGAWELLSAEFAPVYDYSLFNVNIYLERKPIFVIVNVICPIILMAFMSVFVFTIPIDSGERISYGITMLLAIAVFLTLVGDNLPKTSNPMSIFSYYLICILGLNILTSLANIFSLRIYYRDENVSLNTYWINFARCMNCKRKPKRRRNSYNETLQIKPIYSSAAATSRMPNGQAQGPLDQYIREHDQLKRRTPDGRYLVVPTPRNTVIQSSQDFSGKLKDYQNEATRGVSERIDDISWKDVSVAIDKTCFIFTLLLTAGLTTLTLVGIRAGANATSLDE